VCKDATENTDLNGKLDNFIAGPPADETSILVNIGFGEADFKGIYYRCSDPSGLKCNSYEIEWYLLGINQTCYQSKTKFPEYGGSTYCLIEKIEN
jgi:hypothetical protein